MLLNVHPGCSSSLLFSSQGYIPTICCLSNLHWWISRLPPTSCHHKRCYNEHLQTSPLMGLCEILLGNTHRVHFNLTKLYQVALQKGTPGHTSNSRAWIHSKPLALCSFLTLNPGLLSHSTISAILFLSAFISHPPLNCNYRSFIFL